MSSQPIIIILLMHFSKNFCLYMLSYGIFETSKYILIKQFIMNLTKMIWGKRSKSWISFKYWANRIDVYNFTFIVLSYMNPDFRAVTTLNLWRHSSGGTNKKTTICEVFSTHVNSKWLSPSGLHLSLRARNFIVTHRQEVSTLRGAVVSTSDY